MSASTTASNRIDDPRHQSSSTPYVGSRLGEKVRALRDAGIECNIVINEGRYSPVARGFMKHGSPSFLFRCNAPGSGITSTADGLAMVVNAHDLLS